MTKIAVVYHSGQGRTQRQAEAVAEGAASVAGVEVRLFNVLASEEFPFSELATVDAIIFGAPTYMGSLSGPFKTFMDASSKVWFRRGWLNKIAAGFTNSGSQSGDKLSSLLQLVIFAAQHGMIWVGLDALAGNNTSKGSPEDLNRLGSWVGAMAQSHLDFAATDAPPATDLRTAAALGKRVAEQSQRLLAAQP